MDGMFGFIWLYNERKICLIMFNIKLKLTNLEYKLGGDAGLLELNFEILHDFW